MNKTKLSPKIILLFLYHWLCIGFTMGTLILMGPVRWMTNYARAHDWSAGREKTLVLVFIGILIVLSALCARLAAAKNLTTESKAAKAVFLAGSLAIFIISLWFWMTPKMMIGGDIKEIAADFSGIEFVFGPYPEKERLLKLKRENYTAVISLLSPAVVPFEPVLIGQEEALSKEAGIELINIPMLPWISANSGVKEKIEEIFRNGGGKYYVHCYLGKDRVNIFKGILTATSRAAKVKSLEPGNMRTLNDIKKLERGDITVLETDVFFTPLPTDEEFFGYITNGSVRTLVSLLDPENKEDLPWIEKEKKIAAEYHLGFANYSWKKLPGTKKEEAMKELMKLEKPMVIHAFNSVAPECSDFIESYAKAKKGKGFFN